MLDNLNLPKAIYLYNEGVKTINFKALSAFIQKNFGKFNIKIVRLNANIVRADGIIFNPVKTQQSFQKIAPANRQSCDIILTNKLFANYSHDNKLHIWASIYGWPSVISLSGIVEGPAKPKDYYLYKDRFVKLGAWQLEEPKIKKKFKKRFIDYDDKRLNEVLKGYISQALFFYITGEPFCTKKACRLFNAHWQEDLIYSQIRIGRFCSRHRRILNLLKI